MITHGIFIIIGGTQLLILLGGVPLYFIGRHFNRKYGKEFYRKLEDEINKQ